MRPIITLLTDFGLQDGYVASMKGVLLSLFPDAHLVDISHLISPQDIRGGAFVLETSFHWFPPGTIHLAVVDPGVGTHRRGLVIRADHHYFVGPDNGLFSGALRRCEDSEARSIENALYLRTDSIKMGKVAPSATFHGRDVFAPAAAHLALGVPLEAFGPRCSPIIAPWAVPREEKDTLTGEVIFVDRFGNAVTNITRMSIERMTGGNRWMVKTTTARGELTPRVVRTYGEARPGTVLALMGSSDFLEIAINQGHAARELHLGPGSPVSVCPVDS